MRRIPHLIGLIVCLGFQTTPFNYSFAQGSSLMRTDLISPSPTAANLARYGDMPVTYYTGLPNVSIPIFNITGNELNLPVTLTYNYSGLRPAEKASWVGLGWSLQAGGVITRTIGDKIDGSNGYDRETASDVSPTVEYLIDSYQFAMHDNLPDIYNFNFGRYSGKFIFSDDSVYLIPYQKLKIERYNGFKITTEDGTVYQFSETETTYNRPSEGAPYSIPSFTSAWYLSRITNSAGNESIRLYYEAEGMVLQYGMYTQSYNRLTGAMNANNSAPGPLNNVYPTKVMTRRLSMIVSDKYTMVFDAGEAREDIENETGTSKTLEAITVNARDGGAVKTFKFEYDYFGSNAFLKLQSVNEQGTSGGQLMKHTFSYYEDTGGSSGWGNGSRSLADKFGYNLKNTIPSNGMISREFYELGPDRTPVFNAVVKGALKTMTYPTGGKTTFTYELNRYYGGDVTVMATEGALARAERTNPSSSNELYDVDTFRVSHEQYVKVLVTREDMTGRPYDPETDPEWVSNSNVHEYEIREVFRIYDEEGVFAAETVGLPVATGEILRNEFNTGQMDSVQLDPGRYIIRAVCDRDERLVTAEVLAKLDTEVPSPGEPGPGIRVSSLVHDNGFGKTIVKKFSYVNSNGFSSGKVLRENTFDIKDYTEYIYDSLSFDSIWTETREYYSYSSIVSESPGAGLPFYYQRVEEQTISGDEVHLTDYEFEQFASTGEVELVKQTSYVQSDDTFIPAAKTEHWFGEQMLGSLVGMEIYVSGQHIRGSTSTNAYSFEHKVQSCGWKFPYKTRQTRYQHGQAQVTETIHTYDVEDTHNLIATKQINSDGSTLYTRYKYPEDYTVTGLMVEHHVLAPVIEEQVWRRAAGASDSVMISGRINQYDGNRLSSVYALEAAEGISALNDEGTVTLAGRVYYNTLVSDTRYKKKIEFEYDSAGRLIRQQLTDQDPVSYVWGYGFNAMAGSQNGHAYPIAEVKNAAPDAVFYTSFEGADEGSLISGYTGWKAKADSFKIKRSFTGSYMLTYWKKTGSNPWTLVVQTLSDPSNYIIQATGSSIDEVRLYPTGAQLTTYTYFAGLIVTVCDANNKVTFYEYDEANRLKAVRDHNRNLTQTYQYHVKDQYIPFAAD